MTILRRRTRLATITAVLVAALTLSACSGNSDTAPTQEPDASERASSESYPITIDAAYGEITIPTKPERIVVLTPQYVDLLTSIGEQPLATNPGDFATAETFFEFYEWLDGKYDGEIDANLLNREYRGAVEVIAAYEPDLILGNVYSIPDNLYAQMSDIAPTYAGRTAGTYSSWDELLTDLAVMTDKTDEAAGVISAHDASYGEARERIPGLEGATFFAGHYINQEYNLGSASVYPDLGMLPAEGQPIEHVEDAPKISLENIDQLTADVLAISVHVQPEGKAELESDPRFTALPAYQNGTVLWGDWQTARASAEAGPASLAWYLEHVVSQLEQSKLNLGSE